ncbi:MAG: branched-chain amino acid ABC transporter ATP-binding protein [candidate division NC10 bacterium RBG_16_65_8]|nr:MAG: branched-chain amino acid ABC transporter ATP-binding protein [candidate division NC10 bacterium RBG_16_65_8]
MASLEVREVWGGYGDVTVLKGVSLEVRDREVVALVGANGAGKSTLLRTISGLLRPTAGEIHLHGERIDHAAPHHVVELGFVQVPEGKQLFPQMTVEENLLIGAMCSRARGERQRSLEEVYGLFAEIADKRKRQAGSLSGGEQQMVAVGRALMAKPAILAMDEPSLGLAPVVVDRLFGVIQKIRENGQTFLIIEQNVQQTLEMADRGYVMENGQIVLTGSGRELLGNEHLKTHYLGV